MSNPLAGTFMQSFFNMDDDQLEVDQLLPEDIKQQEADKIKHKLGAGGSKDVEEIG